MLDIGDNPEVPQPREMIELEGTFEKLENELKEINLNAESLKRTFLELTELRHILKKTQNFFDEMQEHGGLPNDDLQVQLLNEEGGLAGAQANIKLGFVAGVIVRERLASFERMLWRVCRGNVFLRQAEIDQPLEDPILGDHVLKSVFIIFYQGDQLKTRVKKICEGFHATLYPCPDTPADRREMIGGVVSRIDDLNTVLSQTTEHRHRVLVAAAKNIRNWLVKIRKIKAIYSCLNMFNLDVTQKCLIAECWCPLYDLDRIHLALRRGNERSGSSVPSILNRMQTAEIPPTYNRTNKYTKAFQNLVDSYGVANYRELNPAPFIIITFPFIFATMFGDAGHGFIMTLFAAWMVSKERGIQSQKNRNEIFNTFFSGRYLIFLMGIFSIYTGLLYNDIFSKSLNVFGSAWIGEKVFVQSQMNPTTQYRQIPYPFGIDPIWQVSQNKIMFLNSFKMKLSVIIGVGQMLFGIILNFRNFRHFSDRISIIAEFVPQVVFLMSIFGYMNLLIFFKWLEYDGTRAGCAPSILISLINMFLFKYPSEPCSFHPMFSGQRFLQNCLLLAAFVTIPWMLCLKPFMLKKQQDYFKWLEYCREKQLKQQQQTTEYAPDQEAINVDQDLINSTPNQKPDKNFDLVEICIHQAIHTIEYILGSISHTASYLRLWALSLAHAQLSEVLWNMVLRVGLSCDSRNPFICAIITFFTFYFWAALSFSVLILMEGLSAFLHALRLHWVEFQSKFYKGTGVAFVPFRYVLINLDNLIS